MRKGIASTTLRKYPKELFEKYYVEMRVSYRELNRKYGINVRTITKLLNHYGIQIRKGGEAIHTQREGKKGESRRESEKSKRRYRIKTSDGYYTILFDGEHRSKDRGRVKEHILIMEDIKGRRLVDGEVVHHKDGNKTNNLPSNLEIMTAKEHNKHHYKEMEIGDDGKIIGKN